MNPNNFDSKTAANWCHFWRPAAVLHVRGEDALTFLQGQFSQDLRPGKPGQVAYGLWLTHKGRVLADSFALVVSPAEVWLVSYFSGAAGLREHLEKHIVADDVAIEDETGQWRGLSLGGVGAAAWLKATAGVEPPAVGAFAAAAGGGWVFSGRRGADESWEWLAPATAAWPVDGLPPALSEIELTQLRLAAGCAAVPADIGPNDLPHEGALDDAVAYNKGCYVGQEVMARLRTGTIRRRLRRATGPGEPPPRGTPLYQGDRKLGELRSTSPDGRGGWRGLALVTLLGLDAAAPLAAAPKAEGTVRLLDAS